MQLGTGVVVRDCGDSIHVDIGAAADAILEKLVPSSARNSSRRDSVKDWQGRCFHGLDHLVTNVFLSLLRAVLVGSPL